jgi:hypothetical protein
MGQHPPFLIPAKPFHFIPERPANVELAAIAIVGRCGPRAILEAHRRRDYRDARGEKAVAASWAAVAEMIRAQEHDG